MRTAVLVLTVLVGALAMPAFAQPGAGQPPAVDKSATSFTPPEASPKGGAAPSRDNQADAALAMSIRLRQEAELRIARYACAAGDAAKCAVVQAAKASTTASTPVP